MAPLPNNLTAVMFFDYVTGNSTSSQEHTAQVRYGPTAGGDADPQGAFLALLEGFTAAAFRTGWRVLRARNRAIGSNFTVPVNLSVALGSFVGTGDRVYSPRMEAIEDTIQGRSPTSGRRVDISLYRANDEIDPSFRYGMPVPVQSALSNGLSDGSFLAVDGSLPLFYSYVNQNYNSYWEGELRS